MYRLLPRLSFVIFIAILPGCGSSGGGNTDVDADGIVNASDNCIDIANPSQIDTDNDGAGDACDENDDDDSFPDSSDVDDDNDGLIEVATLQQLDWMRFDLAGTSVNDGQGNVDTSGCPVGGCNGYELVADLDFDTNGDGVMNASDTYFDYDGDGQNNGWLPIGDFTTPYMAHFDGNGHRINNLYINRDLADTDSTRGGYIGLFGFVNGSSVSGQLDIRNITLDGNLLQITGQLWVGSAIGFATDGVTINNISSNRNIAGLDNNIGGLVGAVSNNVNINNCSNSGIISSGNNATGGLVGRADTNVAISNSSATGAVTGRVRAGGLVGEALIDVTINNSTAAGAVTGIVRDTGGLVGRVSNNVTISNSTASGNVSGASAFAGGLVASADFMVTISNSSASGTVSSGGDHTGGLVGLAYRGVEIIDSYATGDVIGNNFTGGLVGSVNFLNTINISTTTSSIDSSFATGAVSTSGNNNYVGGLIGISYHMTLDDSFATGDVSNSNQYVGGLIGDANSNSIISRNFSANTVAGNLDVGALIGFSDNATYADNYFANDNGLTDALGTNNTAGGVNPAGTTGVPLADLQMATGAGQLVNGNNLFTNWGNVWHFGTSTQLPGLLLGGQLFRDGNADGQLD